MDTEGPRILLAGAFLFLLIGYSGIRYLYDSGLPPNTPTLSILGFCGLVAFTYLTGSGGNAGLVSAVNSTAKTFPDQAVRGHTTLFCFECPCSLFINHISSQRASTTGLVISGFGLSAFFFSSISHLLFAGNTSALLLLLALGTSLPMIVGFFFVRPIPLPELEGYKIIEDVEDEPEIAVSAHHSTHLLDHDFIDPHHPHYVPRVDPMKPLEDGEAYSHHANGVELTAQQPSEGQDDPELTRRPRSLSRGAALALDTLPNVYGKKLWRSGDFWLLFSILSVC